MKRAFLVLGVLALVACAPAPDLPPPPPLAAGAVASPEPHATRVGLDALRRGGNAVDAAVSTHFALAVTFPYAGNIGGGGFALVHEPGEGTRALDFRETAPAAAHPALFLDEAGEVVPGLSLNSHLAVGVPGSVAGAFELHRRYGRLSWREVVMPAVHLAREGFVLDAWTAESFADKEKKLSELEGRLDEATDFESYFSGEQGELFKQPELAATLERIAIDGPAEFYHGETAALIVEEMEREGGLITREDLAAYEPRWREPIEGSFRGYRVVSMPPPSSGGIALLQMFGMFEQVEEPDWHSLEHVHLLAEIEKRVYADRARHLGDPDFYEVPVEKLLAESYLEERAEALNLEEKSDPTEVASGVEALHEESQDTLHLSVVDAEGRAVSLTTTINAAYGSGIVVDGAGFLLNNEMDDFSAKPGVPNLFGVTGGEVNKVEGGKRMLSSMTPTIVFDDAGEVRLVLGSPGGSTIITSVFQVVTNRLVYGLSLEEAVAAPRVHHQWPQLKAGEDPLYVEEKAPFRIDGTLIEAIRGRGYTIGTRFKRLGDVQAVEVEGRAVRAVADPRGIGLGGVQPWKN